MAKLNLIIQKYSMALRLLDIREKKKGFVALISVTVLSVISVIIVTSAFSSSTNSLVNLSTSRNALRAKANADSCVELAINKLKTSLDYAGSENVTMDCGSCAISPITGSGNSDRTFTTTGTCNGATRKMSVSITTVNPTTVLSSWNEVQ